MDWNLRHRVAPTIANLQGFVPLTSGDRNLACAFVTAIGLSAVMGLQAIETFGADHAWVQYRIWIVAVSLSGGYMALRIASDLFGHCGVRGVAKAIVGGLWFTALVGLIAGSFMLPVFGTMFGPFAIVMLIIGSPWAASMWIAGLWSIHLMMRCWRTEQDRLFARLR